MALRPRPRHRKWPAAGGLAWPPARIVKRLPAQMIMRTSSYSMPRACRRRRRTAGQGEPQSGNCGPGFHVGHAQACGDGTVAGRAASGEHDPRLLAGVQAAGGVALVRVAQQHVGHRRHRQRQQHAEEAEQRAAAVTAKITAIGCRPMRSPTSFRGSASSSSMICPTVNTTATPARCCQSPNWTIAGDAAEHHDRGRPEVGHEGQQAGDDADQDAEVEAHAPQPDRTSTPRISITRNWPRRKPPSTASDSPGEGAHGVRVVARHQQTDARHQQVPVAQEEEREHRQHDVREQAQQGEARARRSPAPWQRCRQRAPVLADQREQALGIEPGQDLQAGALFDPRAARVPTNQSR